jgi:hypothetical protein
MTEHTATNTTPAYSALKYDPEAYREYVSDMGLSSSQQDALLEAVWLIVVGVIDFGFSAAQFSECRTDQKTLVVDSNAVLASIITSNKQDAEDAKAGDGLSARRMDS